MLRVTDSIHDVSWRVALCYAILLPSPLLRTAGPRPFLESSGSGAAPPNDLRYALPLHEELVALVRDGVDA